MPTDRPRPPSVERLLAAVRPHLALGTEADAVAAVARDVVAEERTRLADGAPPTGLDGLAGNVRERLASFVVGGAAPGRLPAAPGLGLPALASGPLPAIGSTDRRTSRPSSTPPA